MRGKLQEIIKNNGGYVVKEFKAFNNTYCIKPFDNSQESLNAIALLYSNYYANCCMLTPVEMNEAGYKKKLEIILNDNETNGFTYWLIENKETSEPVGFYGFKKIEGVPIEQALDLTLMTIKASIIKPISEVMTRFLFENFEVKELHGNTLSYNQASQTVARQIGMVESGIKNCNDDYIKDSYFTQLILTQDRYNEIKKQNNGVYKALDVPRKTALKDLHQHARTLQEALNEFKQQGNKQRIDHCETILNYLCNRYPRQYKK